MRTPASPNASRVRDDESGTALSPRSTLPATVASSSASASERRAERAPRRLVDDVADQNRVDDVEQQRVEVQGIGDLECV